MKDRVDKLRGIVTLIVEALTKNQTHRDLRFSQTKHTEDRNRKRSDSSGNSSVTVLAFRTRKNFFVSY